MFSFTHETQAQPIAETQETQKTQETQETQETLQGILDCLEAQADLENMRYFPF